MKRILVAFDGVNYSAGVMQMLVRIHQHSPVKVTGAFIPQVDYEKLWSYSGDGHGNNSIPLTDNYQRELLARNIEDFERTCRQWNISYHLKKDYYGFTLPELQRETRFADLMILGGETFYRNEETDLNDYFKEALHHSECPTVVVPEKFNFPRSIILAYDGSASSVYAIKQFAYLFRELCSYPTVLVYATGEPEAMPDDAEISLLVKTHFPNLKMMQLDADPKEDFPEWLNARKRSLLVTGAFGRSLFSQIFKKSFVSRILEQHQIPVFIAHK
jgi:hypothetical protein